MDLLTFKNNILLFPIDFTTIDDHDTKNLKIKEMFSKINELEVDFKDCLFICDSARIINSLFQLKPELKEQATFLVQASRASISEFFENNQNKKISLCVISLSSLDLEIKNIIDFFEWNFVFIVQGFETNEVLY